MKTIIQVQNCMLFTGWAYITGVGFRRETLHVQPVRPVLLHPGLPQGAHKVPHRGETLQVRGVWPRLHHLRAAEEALPHPQQASGHRVRRQQDCLRADTEACLAGRQGRRGFWARQRKAVCRGRAWSLVHLETGGAKLSPWQHLLLRHLRLCVRALLRPGLAHAPRPPAAHREEGEHLPGVRHVLLQGPHPQNPPAHPLRGEALPLRHLPQGVCPTQQPDGPPTHTHPAQALQVPRVPGQLLLGQVPWRPHDESRGGAALRVRGVRLHLLLQQPPLHPPAQPWPLRDCCGLGRVSRRGWVGIGQQRVRVWPGAVRSPDWTRPGSGPARA